MASTSLGEEVESMLKDFYDLTHSNSLIVSRTWVGFLWLNWHGGACNHAQCFLFVCLFN